MDQLLAYSLERSSATGSQHQKVLGVPVVQRRRGRSASSKQEVELTSWQMAVENS